MSRQFCAGGPKSNCAVLQKGGCLSEVDARDTIAGAVHWICKSLCHVRIRDQCVDPTKLNQGTSLSSGRVYRRLCFG
jgi:hypothetical protein